MLDNYDAYKYETPYKGPFLIKHYWTNGKVTLKCGTIKLCIIDSVLNCIHLIQTLNILNIKTNDWRGHIRKVPVTYFCILLNIGANYIIGYTRGH